MSHAEESMEAALNELEARQNNDRQAANQDEASAARIESILARERKDAAAMVGEAYALILLNDKSLDHIKSLSPSTMRLLHNAELLPLREQVRDLTEQLKNSVQVPATLPDVAEKHALQDKLTKEQARSKALNDKIHQLYGEKKKLEKLNSWNKSNAEVSKLRNDLKEANRLLKRSEERNETLRKTHKKSSRDYENSIQSLKDDRDHVHGVHKFREKFFCSCIGLTLEIPNEIKNTWHDIFCSLPQDFTSDLTLEPKNLSHHQLWIVKTPVASRNVGEIFKSPKDDMASPMRLALELYHQLHSRPSKIEEPRTLELMSLVITTISSIEEFSLGQVIIACCRAFYTYGWVPNEEDNRPSFLHGLTSLSMMIMTHQMVMRYPKIEGRYLIEDYVQDGVSAIDPSHRILCKLCTVIPGVTTASIDEIVDSLKVHFNQKVVHYPLGSTYIRCDNFGIDVIGLSLITEPNFDWVIVIEHKSLESPNVINTISKSLFKLSDRNNDLIHTSFDIKDCSKFSNFVFNHDITDKEYLWWMNVTTNNGKAWSSDEEMELQAILSSEDIDMEL
ncbi:hypothetical protein EAE99_009967 [Botrytis elliptica]|nr:hypothetical protein EAE99_009967 [Botrytis elliptica]